MQFKELIPEAIYHSKKGYLFNMDCMKVMQSLPNESIDLIVTDPPYPVTARGSAGNSGGMLQKDINKKGKVFEHNDIDVKVYAPEFYRLLKDGSHCYVMTNHINLMNIMKNFSTYSLCKDCGEIQFNINFTKCPICESKNTVSQKRFHFIKSIIWDKGNKIMGQYYMSQFEYILFFRKGKGKKINNCGTPDILSVPNKKEKDENGKNLHDTSKPTELMKILIENSSQVNDIVFEPFGGIGSVSMACLESDRRFIICEIDEIYSEINKNKIEKYENEKGVITNESL